MRLELDEGEMVTLDDVQGTLIHASEGTLWITEEDDLVDHILEAGHARVVAHPGRTLVQALAPARVTIAPANDPTRSAA